MTDKWSFDPGASSAAAKIQKAVDKFATEHVYIPTLPGDNDD